MASIINASTAGVGGVITTADNSGILNLQTGGTTAVTVDASQNVGVGVTPSAWVGNGFIQFPGNGFLGNATGFSSNNLMLGSNAYYDTSWKYKTSSLSASKFVAGNGVFTWQTAPSGTAGAAITFTDAMTLNASGNLGVGTATPSYTGHFVNSINAASASFGIIASAATTANQYGAFVQLAGDPNNTTNYALKFNGASTERATIRSNGGLANFSANNANLSDERTKKDIVDAGNYLDKICAIPVRTFLYKDQTDDELNLGVIAQEVEAVAPELVDLSGFGETPEDGVPLKAIYQTDLQYALMKSIQELKAIVDTQAEQIKALQGAK